MELEAAQVVDVLCALGRGMPGATYREGVSDSADPTQWSTQEFDVPLLYGYGPPDPLDGAPDPEILHVSVQGSWGFMVEVQGNGWEARWTVERDHVRHVSSTNVPAQLVHPGGTVGVWQWVCRDMLRALADPNRLHVLESLSCACCGGQLPQHAPGCEDAMSCDECGSLPGDGETAGCAGCD